MRTWSPIFNFFAIIIFIVYIELFYSMQDSYQRDFDTLRLSTVLDYATEAAFLNTTEEGDISIDYNNLYTVTLNPSNSLEVLESMICINYGMSITEENLEYVENFIPTAVIACNDGYYITKSSEIPMLLADGTPAGVQYKFKWSLKQPYSLERKDKNGNITKAYSVHLNDKGGVGIRENKGKAELLYFKDYGDIVWGDGLQDIPKITQDEVRTTINSTLTDAITSNIEDVLKDRGGVNFKFYLPASQTDSGINDIKYPSFILIMNGAEFAGKAEINKAVVGGYRTARNVKVIGYQRRIDGELRNLYCYESQMTEEERANNGAVITNYYKNIDDAARAGYTPDYEYIFNKIDTNYK